jgi:HK97 family phage major capsid protein
MKKWQNADGSFKEMNTEEIENLSNEEHDAYLNAKNEQLDAKIKSLVAEGNKENAVQIAELKNEMLENVKKSFDIMKDLGEELANLKIKNSKTGEMVSFKDAIEASMKSNQDKIDAFKSGKIDSTGEIEVKADVTTASVQGSTASYRLEGIGKQPVRRIFLDSLFSQGRVAANSGGTITYWDQDTLVRNADNVAECGLIPESEINWQEYSCKIEKIADSIPVCEEALEDYDFIESEVRNFLLENVLLKLDQQILFGSGTTPQLKGIDTTAQTWVAGAFALAVPTPTTFDVIKIGKTQISNSGENNAYMADTVLMNETDLTAMQLEKDADGQYLLPNYMSMDGLMIDGMRVITSPLVVAGSLYIMDSSKGTVYSHRDLALSLANQHSDDFLHDRLRLKATLRKSFVIRNVNGNAFLKVTDIAAAKTAITKP